MDVGSWSKFALSVFCVCVAARVILLFAVECAVPWPCAHVEFASSAHNTENSENNGLFRRRDMLARTEPPLSDARQQWPEICKGDK